MVILVVLVEPARIVGPSGLFFGKVIGGRGGVDGLWEWCWSWGGGWGMMGGVILAIFELFNAVDKLFELVCADGSSP